MWRGVGVYAIDVEECVGVYDVDVEGCVGRGVYGGVEGCVWVYVFSMIQMWRVCGEGVYGGV